jgi:hypothetical protein
MKLIKISPIALAALAATSLATQVAGAAGWVGSGWDYTIPSSGASFYVTSAAGYQYHASYTIGPYGGIPANVTASQNESGTVNGQATCYYPATYCSNIDVIWGPFWCASDRPGSGSCTGDGCINRTDQLSNSQGNTGYYWSYQGNNYWTQSTDNGSCQVGVLYAGGAYLWQY